MSMEQPEMEFDSHQKDSREEKEELDYFDDKCWTICYRGVPQGSSN